MTPGPGAEAGTPAFFARVTASVSHELKNVLATISESAGLLGDLLDLTPDVGSLDRDEVVSCGTTIIEEVRRGFRIVKNLNRFAHSADAPIAEVDLEEAVTLAAGLAAYLRRSCPVQITAAGSGPSIRTNPILLLEFLHRLLAAAFEVVGSEGELEISTRRLDRDTNLRLDGVPGPALLAAAGPDAMRLAEDLGLTVTAQNGGVDVRIRP